MKANVWRKFLEEQRDQHKKVLFTVTELANVAGVSRATLNVELARLREQAILVKYAHGLYGLPGAVTAEILVPAIDSHAYVTGHYALHVHNLVTQVPTTSPVSPIGEVPERENAARLLDGLCLSACTAACTLRYPEDRSLRRFRRCAITFISRGVRASDRRRWSRFANCSASARPISRTFWLDIR